MSHTIHLFAVDLFCGLGGWAEGFLVEGYGVIGFDIERLPYPGQLVLQDVRTLHGSQFRNATVIIASPPCQLYSYMSMPWKRAKKMAAEYQDGTRSIDELTGLFNACFRIQREASEAAGHKIPLIVENVKGAQPWVGRARWHFGSYYLWGDVPALMPITFKHKNPRTWHDATKNDSHGTWFGKCHGKEYPLQLGNPVNHIKQNISSRAEGIKNARGWWSDGLDSLSATTSSHSMARSQASALIAKIPFPLAQHIARVFK